MIPNAVTPPTSLPIQRTTSNISLVDRTHHFMARWGINRNGHRVNPGLYALGNPAPDSPVFVTANYSPSFDALRSVISGMNSYILVLDTNGINVWCAAGKGTFGTEELVSRIKTSKLQNVVNHRKLIVPQLGATGVAAHEVKKQTGFKVEYGPVRAKDLPQYLKNHQATAEMRQIQFSLWNRMVLIPVEFVSLLLPMLIVATILFFLGGILVSTASIVAILAGIVLFPILLPWLPTPNFSTKGFILGLLAATPFAMASILTNMETIWWYRLGWALTFLLAMPPVTAFLSLNFTGSTTFTSKTGVKREIATFIPLMAWSFAAGLLLILTISIIRISGGF